MAGRVQGKVAFVTGAARGQGRSHALRLAAEGADIIAIDICEDIETNHYPLATTADLEETARLVEKLDRRVVIVKADVRERSQVFDAVRRGVAELGRLDIVVANAGICPLGGDVPPQGFLDAVSVDLIGVINAVEAAFPHLTAGASIICTGSVAGLAPGGTDNPENGPGGAGYSHAKRGVARFVHDAALQFAPHSIRVNAVHPTNVDTDMLQSAPMYKIFRPDLENPTREDAELAFPAMQPMPIPYVEPGDISNAVLFLASDESRYVTGLQLKVDAGALLAGTNSGAPA
ncbi:mycofactocin-coupled SDR family oxidoreductase [Cryptosporangium aurantiacum]|uniref:SDR family mycofactocin-dependent oxidoreductase n=1 Tax=Cryptosporangium aurantiacum TaxID=134849 RepID=A0A1M7RPB4_9ACTN|nr:mycofactocin-coupled SDR family oxidoreductase [Cryptosporangium aurantiacum]SHN47946.1 SDR family mycofactocin-dependent oxidoreductase [Cryptosporangium aurantiacum]